MKNEIKKHYTIFRHVGLDICFFWTPFIWHLYPELPGTGFAEFVFLCFVWVMVLMGLPASFSTDRVILLTIKNKGGTEIFKSMLVPLPGVIYGAISTWTEAIFLYAYGYHLTAIFYLVTWGLMRRFIYRLGKCIKFYESSEKLDERRI